MKQIKAPGDRGHFDEHVDLQTRERIHPVLERTLKSLGIVVISGREFGSHRVAIESCVKHA